MKLEDIHKQLLLLEKNLAQLDSYLLIAGEPHKDKKIIVNIHDLKRTILRLHFMIDLYEYNNKKQLKNERHRLVNITRKMKLLDNYNAMIIQFKQKNSLDIIALLSLIFLPLTLITGYFGMNFEGMGAPSKFKGIFTIQKPNKFVFILFIISIIIFGLLFTKYKE